VLFFDTGDVPATFESPRQIKTTRIASLSGENTPGNRAFSITPGHLFASEENGYITASPFY
jgi:hypothetical protein